MKAVKVLQFAYCPPVWLFCTRHLNNSVNRIRKRALRIAHVKYIIVLWILGKGAEFVLTHVRNLQVFNRSLLRVPTRFCQLLFKKLSKSMTLSTLYEDSYFLKINIFTGKTRHQISQPIWVSKNMNFST